MVDGPTGATGLTSMVDLTTPTESSRELEAAADLIHHAVDDPALDPADRQEKVGYLHI